MKLVILEYLSMLKESGELDLLLPDLLLNMGIIPLSKAQVGVRQYGVDVAAVGSDPDDNNTNKLFLFTIKQGDFSRKNWDNTNTLQYIRPSLNEIIDVYIPKYINEEHKSLPKKVVVCCNGDLKQEVVLTWDGYKSTNKKANELEFDLWDGNKLAMLIEKYLIDEYLFPESAQKHLRKTIALADQNENEPRFFYELIEETLFKPDLPKIKDKNVVPQRQKALCLLNLSLNIVFYWCQEDNNLKPALLCAERTILRTWDWMRQNNLFDCKKTSEKFNQLFFTYLKVINAYAIKLQPHCFVTDGLFGYGVDNLEYPLRTFEVIGILGEVGMAFYCLAQSIENEEIGEQYRNGIQAVAKMLVALIENNPPALMPRYDGHAIDIALGLLTLNAAGYKEEAANWLKEISGHIIYAYNIGKYFPIASDSYEELIAMEFDQAPPKEKLMELSTLIPMLAGWYAILDLSDEYRIFQEAIATTFPNTNLQLWFPDENTDSHLYSSNAGYAGGFTVSTIQLPQTLDDLRTNLICLSEKQQPLNTLSCINRKFSILGLISSRHFRTPVIPAYWLSLASSRISNE